MFVTSQWPKIIDYTGLFGCVIPANQNWNINHFFNHLAHKLAKTVTTYSLLLIFLRYLSSELVLTKPGFSDRRKLPSFSIVLHHVLYCVEWQRFSSITYATNQFHKQNQPCLALVEGTCSQLFLPPRPHMETEWSSMKWDINLFNKDDCSQEP